MRTIHVLAAAAVTAVLGASVGAPTAGAASTGVGDAASDLTVLSVEIGDVISLDLLSDGARSSIMTTGDGPVATASLTPVHVVAPAASIDQRVGEVKTETDGAKDQEETAVLTVPADLAGIASGSLNPASLSSIVDSAGARSSLQTALTQFRVAGALLGIDQVAVDTSTVAAPTGSDSTRVATADSFTVLELGALMEGLGIPVETISLASLLDVLEAMGLPVGDLGTVTNVTDDVVAHLDAISELDGVLDGLLGGASLSGSGFVVAGLLDDLTDLVDDLEGELEGDPITELSDEVLATLAELGIDAPTLTDIDAVTAVLDEVVAMLDPILSQIAISAATANLLGVEGLEANLATIAREAIADSSAAVDAGIGSVVVGGIGIPGVDLLNTAAEIDAVAAATTDQLNGVLGSIHPGLGFLADVPDLLSVSFLDEGTSVTESDGVVTSLASLTAITVTITPPTDLDTIVADLAAGTGLADLLGALDLPIPAGIDGGADAFSAAISSTGAPLSDGATVEVLGFSNSATFSPSSAGGGVPGGGSLPSTGMETTLPLLVGGLAVLAALGVRRALSPSHVRARW
ncbi:MAG TPA: hypothetical protein VGA13_04430 [Acidimicrobiales bacterium]